MATRVSPVSEVQAVQPIQLEGSSGQSQIASPVLEAEVSEVKMQEFPRGGNGMLAIVLITFLGAATVIYIKKPFQEASKVVGIAVGAFGLLFTEAMRRMISSVVKVANQRILEAETSIGGALGTAVPLTRKVSVVKKSGEEVVEVREGPAVSVRDLTGEKTLHRLKLNGSVTSEQLQQVIEDYARLVDVIADQLNMQFDDGVSVKTMIEKLVEGIALLRTINQEITRPLVLEQRRRRREQEDLYAKLEELLGMERRLGNSTERFHRIQEAVQALKEQKTT